MSELFLLLRGSEFERTDASKAASLPPARIILANLGCSGILDNKRPTLVICNCSFAVPFRCDVFNFLFRGKGISVQHKRGRMFSLEDFDLNYFPSDWFVTYHKLGSGFTEVLSVSVAKVCCS